MNVDVREFVLPKEGSSKDEYEDAWDVSLRDTAEEDLFCAVADGATEASFSGLWAKLLTQAFVAQRLQSMDIDSIQELAKVWDAETQRITQRQQVSWYIEQKLQEGAFSSLLGLHIQNNGTWNALCVGDSCLFHVRNRKIIDSLPYTSPTEFNSRPHLVSTNRKHNLALKETLRHGSWQTGDSFFLMTDAIAQCLMLHSKVVFHSFLAREDGVLYSLKQLRERNYCRNDDITFLRIRLTD